MKSLLALVALALIGTCLTACGAGKGANSNASTTSTPHQVYVSRIPTKVPPEPAKIKADADKDNDIGASDDDTNNDSTLNFGHAADTADTQAITFLIKRYYAAAYAENGARACKMIYSTLEEAVPEDYGQSPPGQPYMRGTTCAAVLTLLFKHDHPQLTIEFPKLKISRVRLMEHHGIAILHFGALPERQISVGREGHIWKVDGLLDSEVP
jgi:hypothetical protein